MQANYKGGGNFDWGVFFPQQMHYQRIDVPDSGLKLLEITLLCYHKADSFEDVQHEWMDGIAHAALDCCYYVDTMFDGQAGDTWLMS